MYTIYGFYKFKKIKSLKKYKSLFQKEIFKKDIKGTIILSAEGINGTIAGKKDNINKLVKILKRLFRLKDFDNKNVSQSHFQPFHKGKIKIKDEVVPLGLKINSKNKKLNRYISGKSWNKLISNKETLVVDARKPFEYDVGTFKNAINPKIQNFRDFPKYLKKINKVKPVAMFCTGGIRCEKASVYLRRKGFKNVFQLKGGILNYLNKTEKKESLWKGECFVFDNRVSLKHKLKQGTYSVCSGCRMTFSIKDKKSYKYEEGVSCPRCYDTLSNSQKIRFRMRQNQINLAKKAGRKHKFQKEF
ncbi:MAG: rhodanese-related sulfurtransferase [Candidatus Pelagibacter sp. TMED272]|nr:MAG: rhodanese-related sulfurtransferase [Candidatus Pelagibacter sp. TMED272]